MNILENDAFGHTVGFSSDGITDTYIIGGALEYTFPTGTPTAAAYISMAITVRCNQFSEALIQWEDDKYSIETKQNFFAIYMNAKNLGLTNRIAYIQQLLDWQTSVIVYAAQFVESVKAMKDPASIAAAIWDFTMIPADPQLTPLAAVAINS